MSDDIATIDVTWVSAEACILFWMEKWSQEWLWNEERKAFDQRIEQKLAGMRAFREIESQPGGLFYCGGPQS